MTRTFTAKTQRPGRDEDLVRLYLDDIGRYPMLSAADEARLSQEIEDGNDARACLAAAGAARSAHERRELRGRVRRADRARQQFVQSNLRLVVSIAKRYQRPGHALLDLVQEGNLGLMHAVEKFDWRPGFRFSTYATWWIRQSISRGIVNTGRTVRLPVRASNLLRQVQTVRWRLEVEWHRPATTTEIAAALALPASKVAEVLRFADEPRSLSEPWRDGSDIELGDFLEDRDATSPLDTASREVISRRVAALLDALDDRERRIISLRYGFDRGEPRTLKEVGQHFDVTHERIRQIEARAMSKLRRHAGELEDLLLDA